MRLTFTQSKFIKFELQSKQKEEEIQVMLFQID
jgi:hypothetical protein